MPKHLGEALQRLRIEVQSMVLSVEVISNLLGILNFVSRFVKAHSIGMYGRVHTSFAGHGQDRRTVHAAAQVNAERHIRGELSGYGFL